VPYARAVDAGSEPLEGVLWESAFWLVVLNRNQNLLGKTMIVLRRRLERVADLTPDEWVDLQAQAPMPERSLSADERTAIRAALGA